MTPVVQEKAMFSTQLLLNFPDELILEVIKSLDDDALLTLSMVCRRLNHLALLVVLDRLNLRECIRQGVLKLDTADGFVLSALNLATFVDRLESLDMTLQYMCNFPARLHRLCGFLSKLKKVENKISIVFEAVMPWETNSYRVGRLGNEEEWYSGIADMLNSAVQLPECKLSISGGLGWKTQGKAYEHNVVMENILEAKKIEVNVNLHPASLAVSSGHYDNAEGRSMAHLRSNVQAKGVDWVQGMWRGMSKIGNHKRRVSSWLVGVIRIPDHCPRPHIGSRWWSSFSKNNLEAKPSCSFHCTGQPALSSCFTQQALPLPQTGAVQLQTENGAVDPTTRTGITTSPSFQVQSRLRALTVRPDKAKNPRVTHLEIQTPILFHAPLYECTIHILNNSPLLSLSLDGLGLTHYDWTQILPSITIPTLESLALGDSPIAFPDLVGFLERHKKLRRLDLSKGVAIGTLDSVDTRGLLDNVEELIANPEYLEHFLGSGENLPRLKVVTITSEYGVKERIYNYAQFDGVFKSLARRPMGEEQFRLSIALRCLSSPGLEEWLVDSSKNSDVANVLKNLHLRGLRVSLQAIAPVPETVQTAFLGWVDLFGSIDNVSGISVSLL